MAVGSLIEDTNFARDPPSRQAFLVRNVKRLLGLGAAASVLFAIWRWLDDRRSEDGVRWEPQSFPYPPRPVRGQERKPEE